MLFELPQTSVGFQFVMPMPLLKLKGIGWETITSVNYKWDGREREDDHCLFQYTLSGQGEIEIDGAVYRLKQGDAFIVEIPGDHCYRLPADSSEWEVLYIEFSKEALPFWRQLYSLKGPIVSIVPDSSFIQLAWNTYKIAIKDQIHDVYQSSKYAYQLVMELISHVYQEKKIEPLPSKIELCKQFIELNYQELIGLDDIATAIGISKFYLIREFEKKIGMTPNQYLTKVRIEHAAKLLISSIDPNLEDIARQTGFSSSNYFGKVFKKIIGSSPMEFRRKNDYYEVHRVLFEK